MQRIKLILSKKNKKLPSKTYDKLLCIYKFLLTNASSFTNKSTIKSPEPAYEIAYLHLLTIAFAVPDIRCGYGCFYICNHIPNK